MGALREISGAGTLFANAHLLLGPHFAFLEMKVLPADSGALFMILPPGGFLVLGMLIAAHRRLQRRAERRAAALAGAQAAH
jgi:electron transport complex protein RnfE